MMMIRIGVSIKHFVYLKFTMLVHEESPEFEECSGSNLETHSVYER